MERVHKNILEFTRSWVCHIFCVNSNCPFFLGFFLCTYTELWSKAQVSKFVQVWKTGNDLWSCLQFTLFFFLRQGLSMARTSPSQLVWLASEPRNSSVPISSVLGIHAVFSYLAFYIGSGNQIPVHMWAWETLFCSNHLPNTWKHFFKIHLGTASATGWKISQWLMTLQKIQARMPAPMWPFVTICIYSSS